MNEPRSPSLLIATDDRDTTDLLLAALRPNYAVTVTDATAQALAAAAAEPPAAVLLGSRGAAADGYALCRGLKAEPAMAPVPVIVVALDSPPEAEAEAFAAGTADVIRHPLPALVRARVDARVAGHGIRAGLAESRVQVARWLGHAVEYMEEPAGRHAARVAGLARQLGQAAGLAGEELDLLQATAPLHDIGKAGIPEHILAKPGSLDADEWEIMKRHTTIGAEIIGEPVTPLARMARDVVLCHHEKWNGEGYPAGLAGTDIPIAGRIMAIVDVFDSLTCDRPYKKAWPLDKAVHLVKHESGTLFDPDLVRHFGAIMTELLNLRLQYGDRGER